MTTKSTTKKTTSKTTTQSLDLPKNPLIFEILDLLSKQRSKAKKVEVLQKYDHEALRMLLIWNFDDTAISVLPFGEVPYSGYADQNTYSGTLSTKITEEVRRMYETGSFSIGSSDSSAKSTLRRECKHFYHFVKGGNNSLTTIRRETMFINLLEGLHPLEAEILCLVKDKKLSDKYKITKEIVSEAYPNIIWGGRS
jgi:uncharacterized protein (DUF2237 family)